MAPLGSRGHPPARARAVAAAGRPETAAADPSRWRAALPTVLEVDVLDHGRCSALAGSESEGPVCVPRRRRDDAPAGATPREREGNGLRGQGRRAAPPRAGTPEDQQGALDVL